MIFLIIWRLVYCGSRKYNRRQEGYPELYFLIVPSNHMLSVNSAHDNTLMPFTV